MRYALVTACHNEASNLPRLIASVASQTVLPSRWIIVDDRSTDRSFEVAQSGTRANPKISVVRSAPVEHHHGHSFLGKVGALNTGLHILDLASFDFVGILDADIRLPHRFYERLLAEMAANPNLGLAAGQIIEVFDGRHRVHRVSLTSASGGTQFFRFSCFDSLAGFQFFPYGGEDAALEIEARARGWHVRTVRDLPAYHLGEVGSAAGSRLKARFRRGRSFYQLGYHPLFQALRAGARIVDAPLVVGSIAETLGYLYSATRGDPILLGDDIVTYLRSEQLARVGRARRIRNHRVA